MRRKAKVPKVFPLFLLAVWPQRWTWLASCQWKTGGERWHSGPISWQPSPSAGIRCLPEQITPGMLTQSPESVLTADLTQKGISHEKQHRWAQLIQCRDSWSLTLHPHSLKSLFFLWIFSNRFCVYAQCKDCLTWSNKQIQRWLILQRLHNLAASSCLQQCISSIHRHERALNVNRLDLHWPTPDPVDGEK